MRLGRTIATRVVRDASVSEVVGLITGAIAGDANEEGGVPTPDEALA